MAGGDKSGEPIGRRLLPQVVDRIARRDPDKVFTSTPRTTDLEDGFYDVTYAELSHLVNYMSWWIESNMGRGENFETLGYMGTTDFRYIVVFLAAIKCGYKLFVPSTRNSMNGNLSLFNQLECVKFMHSSDIKVKAEELKKHKSNLQLYSIPSYKDMLYSPTNHYPFDKSYEEAEFDDVFVCHTSGTTGTPKPITVNNGHFTTYDNLRNLPKVPGRQNLDYSSLQLKGDGRYYSPFPPFHMGGMLTTGVLPIWYETPVIVGLPDKPPSGDILAQVIQLQPKLRALMTPPTPIEQLLSEPNGLQLAGRLDFVLYGGGPLSPIVGERLRQATKVAQLIGSTELGMVPLLFPDQEIWNWFEWHPYYKLEMQHVHDNVYEMVVPYDPDQEWICRVNQVPPQQEWRTRDLFERHPVRPELWRFYGRRDDVIVLSNGEKFNPVTMEGIISGHPLVRGAVIVGTGRFQAALLLELKPGVTAQSLSSYTKHDEHHANGHAEKLSNGKRRKVHHSQPDPRPASTEKVNGESKSNFEELIINEIWPSIEHANNEGPQHGRIFRSKIHIAASDKPFARSGKGSVIRSMTEKLYANEIEHLYSGAKERDGLSTLPTPCTLADVQTVVRNTLTALMHNSDLSDDDDFFALGLDSLQTLEIVNALKAVMESFPEKRSLITIKAVYSHPNVTNLSLWLHQLLEGAEQTGNADVEMADMDMASADESRIQNMSAMVARYTNDMPMYNGSTDAKTPLRKRPQGRNICVALTGSTGTLGMNILQTLLQDPRVSRIYCLNRAADAWFRHSVAFEERGLPYLLDNRRVVFLTAKFGDSQFGQSDSVYEYMLNDVDVVIHNAWKVNFHHRLESFEPEHVRGTYFLIEWCRKTSASMLFVSSIASISFHAQCFPEANSVPETPLTDYRTAKDIGYGESKHVAERLLQIARDRCGVLTSNLRVGQVAGPTSANGGVWNRHEHIPAMIQTSLELGCMPETFQDIDWTPVDDMARIIVDLMHATHRGEVPQVFHLTNPHVVPWSDFVETTQAFFAKRRHIRAVPLSEWVELLQKTDQTNPEEMQRLPAAKILDFFEDAERDTRHLIKNGASNNGGRLQQWLDTHNGVHASQTMAKLQPMTRDLFETWLKQWNF